MTSTRTPHTATPTRAPHPVYAVATRFREDALDRGATLFDGRRRIWTVDRLAALTGRLEERLDGDGPFVERWRGALEGADPLTVQLAAELLVIHLLFPSDLRAETKRGLVRATMDLAAAPLPPSSSVEAALESGIAPTGVAYKRLRLSQLVFLAEASLRWRRAAPAQRTALAEDPAACRAWLDEVPDVGGSSQREALAHLLHPDAFEPIVSAGVKYAILAAFGGRPADEGVDTALAALRRTLTPRHGKDFSFFDPAVARHWRA